MVSPPLAPYGRNIYKVTSNPLLTPSTLPYGLPNFAELRTEHYAQAFAAGFAQQRQEIAAITDNPEAATFANTIEALEKSGSILHTASNVFFNIAASDGTEDIQALEAALAPQLAAHSDAIFLNAELFARVAAVPGSGLSAEQDRVRREYLNDFRRAGVAVQGADQERLRAINAELSSAAAEFSQLVTQAGNDAAVHILDVELLAGMSAQDLATAAAAAREAGHGEGYLLTLVLPTAQPALEVLSNRTTRHLLYRAAVDRGQNAAHQPKTLTVAAAMAALRAEKAQLLGFENEAERLIEPQTAPSLAAVRAMLEPITAAAVRNAKAEADRLSKKAGYQIEAWDWAYWSERVRREECGVDLGALRPWFELERVLKDGVFFAAGKLFGLQFTERPELPVYHPDARTWEVHNADGTALGLFVADFYTRPTKRGGAWMNSFVEQSRLLGTRAVVVNNLNIPKPPAGEPTLLSYDELVTCFHEFGHALHGLFSDVEFPKFSGTNVPRDFVEYPSQVNEMWVLWPEVLDNYARHHQTGEPLPAGTSQKLRAAALWGQGFATTEYLGAALLDLAWHELPAGTLVADPTAFEAAALEAAGVLLPAVPPRYRTGYFNHIFAGGYAAGYYSYIWSEVLDADTVSWFKEHGGLTRANGDHFRATLLGRGFSVDPLQAFYDFAGRTPRIEPLLERRGLN